jgi:hypothetical protein
MGSGTRAFADSLITIVPTFDSTITSDPNAAAIEGTINSAVQYYNTHFTTHFAPLTVNITFEEMTTGLGASSTVFFNGPYAQFITQLHLASSGDATDTTALAHLPIQPTNPVTGDANINVKSANLRALGIATPGVTTDGFIGLNTHITDVGSPGTSGVYSLFATTEHEIDEVLGMGSALPSVRFGDPFPTDLFRYDNTGARTFTTNSSTQAFFSLDGTTHIAQFDNQNDGGDFGDWQSNPLPAGAPVRVQDAFATPFSHPTLANDGGAEIVNLDAIGYNLESPATTPEPASVVLLGLGLLLGGLGARRWQKRLQQVA